MGKMTGNTDDFLVLRHPDKSPAIFRISRIQDVLPMDLHRCRIIYDNGMEMIVEGDYTDLLMRISDKFAKKEGAKHGRKRKG